jgi:GcrA cell cycle regulator
MTKRQHEVIPWTERDISTLCTLWAEGVTTAKIGERINRNVNQVIGKVHRLRLVPRPNPVKRTYEKKTRARPVLPPKSNGAPYTLGVAEVVDARTLEVVPTQTERVARVPVSQRLPSATPSPHKQCQWPLSERPWVFCCAPTVRGLSWCAEHREQVFVRRADAGGRALFQATSSGPLPVGVLHKAVVEQSGEARRLAANSFGRSVSEGNRGTQHSRWGEDALFGWRER